MDNVKKCPKCNENCTDEELARYGSCFDCELDAFERGEYEEN